MNAVAYEAYYSDHKPIFISLFDAVSDNQLMLNPDIPDRMKVIDIVSHEFDLDDEDTMDFEPSPMKSSAKTGSTQDVILDRVFCPSPIHLVPNELTVNTFTVAMRKELAESINLGMTPIRPRIYLNHSHLKQYYAYINEKLRQRFNLQAIPVGADGNCFFRSLSHIIFGDETEHYNMRANIIETFRNSPFIGAFCGYQGYNEIALQQHMMDMLPNNTWGTINELIMFGILAGVNVSYVNATDHNPTKWAFIDVYKQSSLDLPMNPLFQGKSLVLLFHSVNFSGPDGHHYDPLYLV